MGRDSFVVTLEDKLAEELRCAAGPRGAEAYLDELVRQRLQALRMRRYLDELAEEFGPIPEEVQREVDALPWPGLSATAGQ